MGSETAEDVPASTSPAATTPTLLEERFDDAERFLDALSARDGRWAGPGRWVYRGQGGATRHLVPTAFRDAARGERPRLFAHVASVLESFSEDVRYRSAQSYYDDATVTYDDRVRSRRVVLDEWLVVQAMRAQLLRDWIEVANTVGLPLPDVDDTPDAAGMIERLLDTAWVRRPGRNSVAIYSLPSQTEALARHHGLPSELLDVTRRAWIAAFFAAEPHAGLPAGASEDLTVWAINLDHPAVAAATLHVFDALRSQNEFLRAQDGLFLWSPMLKGTYLRHGRWQGLDEVLIEHAASDVPTSVPVTRKLSLAAGKSRDLMELLAMEHITPAHLMPTYANVKRVVDSRW